MSKFGQCDVLEDALNRHGIFRPQCLIDDPALQVRRELPRELIHVAAQQASPANSDPSGVLRERVG